MDAFSKKLNKEAPQVNDGKLKVPDQPGLGIQLNPEVLQASLMEGKPWWD